MALQPGTVVKSPQRTYLIEKVLGQGGFGITYQAETQAVVSSVIDGPFGSERQTKTVTLRVALKEFFMKNINGRSGTQVTTSEGNNDFQKYYTKFGTEADNLKQISHPNIIKVLERFPANGTQYYAMELIDGGNLDAYITRRGGLSVDESTRLIKTIGRAIQYMHDHRMLHLDLKPNNVMMRRDGTPVVIDFGLSKQYNEKGEPESSTTIGAGTPGFAPIEQTSYHGGREFPTTLDVYALGATLYKMLTGTTPAPADEVLNNGLDTAPLRSKGADDALIRLITDAMHPMRKQRIQTVAAFLSQLSDGMDDEPLTVELGDETETQPLVSQSANEQRQQPDVKKPEEKKQDKKRQEEKGSPSSPTPKRRVVWAWVGLACCVICLGYYVIYGATNYGHIITSHSMGLAGYLTCFVGIAAFITLIRRKSWAGWMVLFSGIAMLVTHFWLGAEWINGYNSFESLASSALSVIAEINSIFVAVSLMLMFLAYRETIIIKKR